MRIAYVVHDLADAAVARRVRMLCEGGAEVALAGFHRSSDPPATVAGVSPVSLGRTHDGAFTQRAMSVVRSRGAAAALAEQLGPVDAILARNLEALPLASTLRARLGGRARLVYEVLDIHRLLLGGGPAPRVLRTIEARLARDADALITSSPAFVESYFRPVSGVRCPITVVENTLLEPLPPEPPAPAAGPPWRIGVFGALRCRTSLDLLRDLARTLDGKIEVVVRGRPSPAVFPDGLAEVARWPFFEVGGPYVSPDDLGALYENVHFVWAIDFFEAGANSEWLLPNRLYEAGAFRRVPIAREGTATAALMREMGFGHVAGPDIAADLAPMFRAMTAERYARERDKVARVPRSRFLASKADCVRLVATIAGEPGEIERVAA